MTDELVLYRRSTALVREEPAGQGLRPRFKEIMVGRLVGLSVRYKCCLKNNVIIGCRLL